MTTTAAQRDGAALLKAVLDDPADDLPRLLYADWCDDVGQPERAELVRVQVGLARWKGKDEDHCPECGLHWHWRVGAGWDEWSDCDNDHRWCREKRRDLARRERDSWASAADAAMHADALEALGVHLPAPISGWGPSFLNLAIPETTLTFARGFVSRVRLPQDAWLEHGPAIVRAHPVEVVTLSDKSPLAGNGVYTWRWESAPWTYHYPQCDLRYPLYRLLKGGWTHHGGDCRQYRSEEDANADLLQACLLYARRPNDPLHAGPTPYNYSAALLDPGGG